MYMRRFKEDILSDNQLSTSFSTNNSTPSTSSFKDNSTPSTSSFKDNSTPSMGSSTTRSSDTNIYIYVFIVAVLTIGAYIFGI